MNKNKTKYSPTEALKHLESISKNSLYDAMNNGNISYTEEPWGKRKRRIIDGSELARYYKESFKPQNDNGSTHSNNLKQPQTRINDTGTTLNTDILEQKIAHLNERLEEVQQQRDSWEKQAQTLLLQSSTGSKQGIVERKQSLFSRIFR